MKRKTVFTGTIVVLLFSACSSYLTSSENVGETKKPYEKILVVGRSKDNTARIKFENSVVSQLKEVGVKGTASHAANKVIDLNKKYSETELVILKKTLMAGGYDGVIVTNLINTEEYTDVIPGNTSTAYVPTRAGRFGRYLVYYPVTRWEPDQLRSGTKYVFESSLYRLTEDSGDNLQWIGRFEVKDPSNLTNTVNKYAKDLTNALIKSSISTDN